MSFEDAFDRNHAYSITSKHIQLSENCLCTMFKNMKTSRYLDFM